MEIGKTTHRLFCRWRDEGISESLLEKAVDDPDFEWLIIDASHMFENAFLHLKRWRGIATRYAKTPTLP